MAARRRHTLQVGEGNGGDGDEGHGETVEVDGVTPDLGGDDVQGEAGEEDDLGGAHDPCPFLYELRVLTPPSLERRSSSRRPPRRWHLHLWKATSSTMSHIGAMAGLGIT